MPKLRSPIAVVDDNASFLAAVTNLLASADFPVQGFLTARAFLDAAPVERFACLVLDIDLGETSGLELQHQLKTIEPTLPVILMSGSASPLVQQAVLQSGCAAFLPKPFAASQLIAAINRTGSLATPTFSG